MTTLRDEITFVNNLLESLYDRYSTFLPAQESPEDGGVPPAMQAGPIGTDGWVKWRLLPSTVSEVDVPPIEETLGVALPSLLKAFLLGHHHLFDQLGSDDHTIMMPATPIDRPFKAFTDEAMAWSPLLYAGLLPFGEYGDGWGPCCLDLLARSGDNDNPVVWLDHEHLISLTVDSMTTREGVQALIQPLYPSFRRLLTAMFIEYPYPPIHPDTA